VPAGRPSKYKPEFIKLGAKVAKLGATDAELADIFGCDVSTFYRWQAEHPEFREAIQMAKDEPDDRVERSLYARAVGYSHPDVHISNFQGEVTITPIVKYYPPDTAAAFIWLKNRRGDLWRDKREVEHSGTVTLAQAIEEIAQERLNERNTERNVRPN